MIHNIERLMRRDCSNALLEMEKELIIPNRILSTGGGHSSSEGAGGKILPPLFRCGYEYDLTVIHSSWRVLLQRLMR